MKHAVDKNTLRSNKKCLKNSMNFCESIIYCHYYYYYHYYVFFFLFFALLVQDRAFISFRLFIVNKINSGRFVYCVQQRKHRFLVVLSFRCILHIVGKLLSFKN